MHNSINNAIANILNTANANNLTLNLCSQTSALTPSDGSHCYTWALSIPTYLLDHITNDSYQEHIDYALLLLENLGNTLTAIAHNTIPDIEQHNWDSILTKQQAALNTMCGGAKNTLLTAPGFSLQIIYSDYSMFITLITYDA